MPRPGTSRRRHCQQQRRLRNGRCQGRPAASGSTGQGDRSHRATRRWRRWRRDLRERQWHRWSAAHPLPTWPRSGRTRSRAVRRRSGSAGSSASGLVMCRSALLRVVRLQCASESSRALPLLLGVPLRFQSLLLRLRSPPLRPVAPGLQMLSLGSNGYRRPWQTRRRSSCSCRRSSLRTYRAAGRAARGRLIFLPNVSNKNANAPDGAGMRKCRWTLVERESASVGSCP